MPFFDWIFEVRLANVPIFGRFNCGKCRIIVNRIKGCK